MEFGLFDYSWRLVKLSCDLILKLDLFVLEISNCELNKDLLNWKFRCVTISIFFYVAKNLLLEEKKNIIISKN